MSTISAQNGTSLHHRHRRLGEFLRSRRAVLTPEDLGLPRSARRRTPGLRREEVAVMANVGVSWYTWLEQGRAIGASAEVLEAIADVLGLDDDERRYVRRLSRGAARARTSAKEDDRRQLDGLVGAMTIPAYVADPYWRVVAANALARRCFDVQVGKSCLERFFLEEGVAERYVHRELMGRSLVEQFRARTALHPDDGAFDEMTVRLREGSPLFRQYWDQHVVGETYRVDIVFEHATLGMLSFKPVLMSVQGDAGLRLYSYLPRAGTRTVELIGSSWESSQGELRDPLSGAG